MIDLSQYSDEDLMGMLANYPDVQPQSNIAKNVLSAIGTSPFGQAVGGGIDAASDVMGNVAGMVTGKPYTEVGNKTEDINTLAKQGFSKTTWPVILGAGEEALMNSPTGKMLGVASASPQGEILTPILNAANQEGEKIGIPHQVSQAAEFLLPFSKTARDIAGSAMDNLAAKTANTAPRQGFLTSESSDPMAPPPDGIPTSQQIKAASGAKYEAMRNAGAVLNQSGIGKVTYSIGKALSDSGLMNKTRHGDTMSVIEDLNNDAAKGNLDLEKLDQYRQSLNEVVKDNTSKIDGPNSDAHKAQVAINAMDDAVEQLGQQHLQKGTPQAIDALNKARDLYSVSSRMRDIQRIQDNAYMTDNPATAMRTGFRTLAKKIAANPRGWTAEEATAINNAAHTGIATGALKVMGSRLISGVSGGAAGALGGGIPGAIAGVGVGEALSYPLRSAANALQAKRGDAVTQLLANRPIIKEITKKP